MKLSLFFALTLICSLLAVPPGVQAQFPLSKVHGITYDNSDGTGLAFKVRTRQITAAATLTTSDHTVLANATSAAFTVKLPAAGTNTNTQVFVIQKTDSSTNAVTVSTQGTDRLDGGTATVKLTRQYQTLYLSAGFGGWHILGQPPANTYVVTATSTLTSDQLWNSTIVNTGASGAVVLTLPAPIPGQRVFVFLTDAQDVDINPADGTQILVMTNAAGDAVSSAATAGNSLTLVAISTTAWVQQSSSGVWTDVN